MRVARGVRPAVLAAVVVLACAVGQPVLAGSLSGPGSATRGGGPSDVRRQVQDWSYPAGPDIPWTRIVSGTLVVAGLVCLGVWVLKRLNGGASFSRGRHLEVLEARSIGRNVQLFLVRAAGKVLLLASGGGAVTCVTEFAPDELRELEPESAAQGIDGFRCLLKRLAGARQ